MRLFYVIGLGFYRLGISLASLWNRKAAMWIEGRRDWKNRIKGVFSETDQVIWIHCSSLGEFEQGRPVIERIRSAYPDVKLLLTFFSPSGYEKRKNYESVDHVAYIPFDTRKNARYFLEKFPVKKAIFIKYEFWYHFIECLSEKQIPVYLVSGIFRKNQPFFKWYGNWYRKMLHMYSHIYVQDEASLELLEKYDTPRCSIAGDTRFDRVMDIAAKAKRYASVEAFVQNRKVLLCGSTWKEDEEILKEVLSALDDTWCLVIAPHEPDTKNLERLGEMFPDRIRLTELLSGGKREARVLIVDTIGHLSSLYKYGTLAYIGGGFGKGIHNILEATAAGLPVFFGPEYHKFKEAVDLVRRCGAFMIGTSEELIARIKTLDSGEGDLLQMSELVRKYTVENTGATDRVVKGMFREELT